MELKPSVLCLFSGAALLLLVAAAPPVEDAARAENVPLMAVIEYFDFGYNFSSTIGAFTIDHGGNSIVLLPGSNEVWMGNRIVHMEKKVLMEEDQIFIHADYVDLIIQQLLKKNIAWSFDGTVFTVIEKEEIGKRPYKERDSSKPDYSRSGSRKRSRSPYEIKAIIIDAGHGGKDPGGIGYSNIKEKRIVLEVANELKKELRKRFRDKEVILTREDDTFMSLEKRGEIANLVDPSKNPIFISIHANVSFSLKTYGYESFFLSIDPFGESARDVASMENSVLNFEIENYNDYLKEIINRIVDIEYRRESMRLAEYIQKRMNGTVGSESVNRGVKSAFFYVLKSAKMPAVLVEVGFVTNESEALKLQKPDYQKKLARGIVDGIEDFVMTFHNTEGFTR